MGDVRGSLTISRANVRKAAHAAGRRGRGL